MTEEKFYSHLFYFSKPIMPGCPVSFNDLDAYQKHAQTVKKDLFECHKL